MDILTANMSGPHFKRKDKFEIEKIIHINTYKIKSDSIGDTNTLNTNFSNYQIIPITDIANHILSLQPIHLTNYLPIYSIKYLAY